MRFPRASGIVLHLTSLPGGAGIGDMGPAAYRFVDTLVEMGQSIWQVMPLGPTGFGDSPYQCFSAFAGNPLLISPELLLEAGWLTGADLADQPRLPADRVAYCDVVPWKSKLVERAFERFEKGASAAERSRFDRFRSLPAVRGWLPDYCLFRALKDHYKGAEWAKWDPDLVRRRPAALEAAQAKLARGVRFHEFTQFVFFQQWQALRSYAQLAGVKILGDVPIFVAHDSADAWANQEQFFFADGGVPTVVAGVPPDYFSKTGQRWGNPLYRWEAMEKDGFSWWVARLASAFLLMDIVRLDHFRGFQAYWEVPAAEATAVNGRWVEAPGEALFAKVKKALGDVPIVAEDLGIITPPVEKLRDGFDFPGMKILQFAFGGDSANEYLPHNYHRHAVVYTGTHDNDTAVGWYQKASPKEKDGVRRYLGRDGRDIAWDLIRAALASVADTALVPLQDVLEVGSDARMNTPGLSEGNWAWRFSWDQLTEDRVGRMYELAALYGRVRE